MHRRFDRVCRMWFLFVLSDQIFSPGSGSLAARCQTKISSSLNQKRLIETSRESRWKQERKEPSKLTTVYQRQNRIAVPFLLFTYQCSIIHLLRSRFGSVSFGYLPPTFVRQPFLSLLIFPDLSLLQFCLLLNATKLNYPLSTDAQWKPCAGAGNPTPFTRFSHCTFLLC